MLSVSLNKNVPSFLVTFEIFQHQVYVNKNTRIGLLTGTDCRLTTNQKDIVPLSHTKDIPSQGSPAIILNLPQAVD